MENGKRERGIQEDKKKGKREESLEMSEETHCYFRIF